MEDGAAAAGAGDGAARAQQVSSGTKRARGGAMMRGGIEPLEPAAAAWGHPPPALPPPPPPQQQAGGAMGTTASRICRMRGATGGKDRHSKVYTAKGIRDRRVRLSVPTAIQFYDLQDRLGYDQPSKAIEWLINAAADAIDKLPELDPAAFAAVPSSDPADLMVAKVKQSKSSPGGSGSTSETSKGSELSLSRSDSREVTVASTSSAQAASFTELLTGVAEHHRQQAWGQAPAPNAAPDCADDKAAAAANGLFTGVKFGNAPPFGLVPAQPFSFPITSVEMPHHHFTDALAPASAPAGDYNLNFSMSSGFLGAANRGTLQSNSQASFSSGHHHQQLQPFLFGHSAAAAGAAHPASENQLSASAALQLWDGFRHSGMKEKTKN
ncbi:hypothetical protein PR202_gb10722 [Eleusine coracana subsp. coracana]|uniref:TCP domain-containing protein n=1 Tax=Eleusine coracana subsp. coracana TaxID=191504 RepID=A0AAV5EKP4_ELECO|nr:hypothetical protein QOZ80_3BG0258580 [Eleusine coracana subsp. coracana]GJN23104.1 hypothetical protein PR202_gb10722 [Eleusine coracana subsp. coracana]